MDFSITMPHHLSQTDARAGAYAREGKSYHRAWLHAICYGGKTRYFTSDNTIAYQVRATQAYAIPVLGEEENKLSVGEIEITQSLTNPLAPQTTYTDEMRPWEAGTGDAASRLIGVHPLPANERKMTGRGLTMCLYMQDIASKVKFNGWGGEFGPGPQTIYGEDPTYPAPNPVP
jgi:hypothetical protein